MSNLKIFKNNTAILIIGREVQANYHSHHALQVSFALGEPFSLRWQTDTATAKSGAFEGVIIAPDLKHSLDGEGAAQALLLIDPEHAYAQQLSKIWLKGELVAPLPAQLLSPLIKKLTTEPLPNLQAFGSTGPITELLSTLLPEGSGLAKIDHRVRAALDYLQSQPIKSIAARELADAVHLSESRLAHLFKQQVGIPVRRYLMWLRLMDAIDYAFTGNTLTDAAASAGFADSAHFTRTFQAMFGIQPSVVVQHSQFVQVP